MVTKLTELLVQKGKDLDNSHIFGAAPLIGDLPETEQQATP